MITVERQGALMHIKAPYDYRLLLKGIPGARWDAIKKTWTYPATPFSASQICKSFTTGEFKNKVEFDQGTLDLRGQMFEAQRIKESTFLDPIPYMHKTSAWDHQKRGYALIRTLPSVMLGFDMGTGKTFTAIAAVHNADVRTLLIVCPKSVVDVWPNEFAKHLESNQLNGYMIVPLRDGSTKARAEKIELKSQIAVSKGKRLVVIVNYEAAWQGEMSKWLLSKEWDCIIADEIHRIKSPQGRISKFMAKLNGKRRIGLTGTPMPHSPMDVFGQYRFLDPSIYGTSFTAFRSRYAVMGGYQNYQVVSYRNEEELHDRFFSIALRVKKQDVLDLPPEIDQTVNLTLPPKSRRVYEELKEEAVALIEQGVITAGNALTKLIRLQQITSGFCKNEEDEIVTLDSDKQKTLRETLDDMPPNEPVVVFARFHQDLNSIVVAASEAGRPSYELSGRTDANELGKWQDAKDGSVIAVQMQSGGVGVDLTRSCYCIYYSLSWSLGDYLQSRARLHRHGQTRPVTYLHFVTENTVDETVCKALEKRNNVIENILAEMTGSRELAGSEVASG